jgi:hypothetical protein
MSFISGNQMQKCMHGLDEEAEQVFFKETWDCLRNFPGNQTFMRD